MTNHDQQQGADLDPRVVDYFYGEMTPQEREDFEQVLSQSEVLSKQLRGLEGLAKLTRAASPPEPSAPLVQKILLEARKGPGERAVPPRIPWWERLALGLSPRLGLGIAVLLVVAVGVYLGREARIDSLRPDAPEKALVGTQQSAAKAPEKELEKPQGSQQPALPTTIPKGPLAQDMEPPQELPAVQDAPVAAVQEMQARTAGGPVPAEKTVDSVKSAAPGEGLVSSVGGKDSEPESPNTAAGSDRPEATDPGSSLARTEEPSKKSRGSTSIEYKGDVQKDMDSARKRRKASPPGNRDVGDSLRYFEGGKGGGLGGGGGVWSQEGALGMGGTGDTRGTRDSRSNKATSNGREKAEKSADRERSTVLADDKPTTKTVLDGTLAQDGSRALTGFDSSETKKKAPEEDLPQAAPTVTMIAAPTESGGSVPAEEASFKRERREDEAPAAPMAEATGGVVEKETAGEPKPGKVGEAPVKKLESLDSEPVEETNESRKEVAAAKEPSADRTGPSRGQPKPAESGPAPRQTDATLQEATASTDETDEDVARGAASLSALDCAGLWNRAQSASKRGNPQETLEVIGELETRACRASVSAGEIALLKARSHAALGHFETARTLLEPWVDNETFGTRAREILSSLPDGR